MATTKETEAEEKLLQVTAPPPSIYYKKYTKEAVHNGTAPLPPTPPSGEYSAFGIAHNVRFSKKFFTGPEAFVHCYNIRYL